jgi:solute carrier family 45 protein 1/2/4
MPALFPFLGQTELEVLSVVGAIILIGTHIATLTTVKERILLASGCVQVLSSSSIDRFTHGLSKIKKSLTQEMNELWVNARNLPPVIRQIVRHTSSLANKLLMERSLLQCLIQFLCVYHHVL